MWKARTKDDLIIEVWEQLDCENVGAKEILAIEAAVKAEYGAAAVGSPMIIARLLADEGAELRHSEIMKLYVERASVRPYDAALRNVFRLDDLRGTLTTINDLENLRKRFKAERNVEGNRAVRVAAIREKQGVIDRCKDPNLDHIDRQIGIEITQWLSLWLQTPELFEDWVAIRQRSKDFIERFGQIGRK